MRNHQPATLTTSTRHLRFYTEMLGFAKKTDVSQGPYRWLTVALARRPETGLELPPRAQYQPGRREAYQQALFEQDDQPAIMFYVDDVQAETDRLSAAGADLHDAADEGHRLDHRRPRRYLSRQRLRCS